jgi:hypothetical protein
MILVMAALKCPAAQPEAHPFRPEIEPIGRFLIETYVLVWGRTAPDAWFSLR